MTHTLVKKNYIPEPALFILWQHCTLDRLMVRESMQKKFGNILTYSIQWNDKIFSQNLTRFYGEKLPQNSSKEIHIGKGAFDVFLFQEIILSTIIGKRHVDMNLSTQICLT